MRSTVFLVLFALSLAVGIGAWRLGETQDDAVSRPVEAASSSERAAVSERRVDAVEPALEAPPEARPNRTGTGRFVRLPEDVPADAINAEIARATLASNTWRLVPVELDCGPRGDQKAFCVPIPETTLANHPYFSYPIESLLMLRGDPIAHQVISLRVLRDDPDAALQHAIWATGMSGGRPEPLVDFVRSSGWSAMAGGEPFSESFAAGYVLLEAARRLGYPAEEATAMVPTLRDHLTEAEMEALEVEISDLLSVIADVPVARAWEKQS